MIVKWMDKIYDTYYAGQKQDPFHSELPAPLRPWYYPLVCLVVWTYFPFYFIGGMFLLITHVIRGEIELPPDYGSYIGFAIVSAFFLLLVLGALLLSIYILFHLFI